MAKKIPGLPLEWQEYLLCLLFHMVFPLLPLGLELWIKGDLSSQTLLLGTSMYSIAIGLSSKSKFIFGVGFFVSFSFAVIYGHSLSNKPPLYSIMAAKISIISVFIMHALERYNIHVVDLEPFSFIQIRKG